MKALEQDTDFTDQAVLLTKNPQKSRKIREIRVNPCPIKCYSMPVVSIDFEHELHERVMAIEREMLEKELTRYDVTVKEIEGMTYRHTVTSLVVVSFVSVVPFRFGACGRVEATAQEVITTAN